MSFFFVVHLSIYLLTYLYMLCIYECIYIIPCVLNPECIVMVLQFSQWPLLSFRLNFPLALTRILLWLCKWGSLSGLYVYWFGSWLQLLLIFPKLLHCFVSLNSCNSQLLVFRSAKKHSLLDCNSFTAWGHTVLTVLTPLLWLAAQHRKGH